MNRRRSCWLAMLAALSVAIGAARAVAEPVRVLPAGQRPADRRLAEPIDLNGYFPFQVAKSPAAWERRAEQVRRQLLVSLGLWPMPKSTPLKAMVHGKVQRDDYSVEKVYFESLPGFYVTGSLYRPLGSTGKMPAVLCPHGHWSNGRFHDKGPAEVKKEIAQGGERFEEGGRSPLQARCVHLARMGCVVFHYDMIGYADSTQISFQVAHRFAKQRPEMNRRQGWQLFSPLAESHLQSVMGLQTYNSLRAIDFVQSLPDVDPERIAVTGASGGGTQTFILCAIDSRPIVAMPAVMVSTAMQGGCTCENASLLRVGTGNVEFAALMAPRPLALTAANDWTKEIKTKGFPELQEHYAMLGAKENVTLLSRTNFGHNYNQVSRRKLYEWFKKHLELPTDAPLEERDYKRLTLKEMTVWDDQHPRPPVGPTVERKIVQRWHEDSRRQLADAIPKDAASWDRYKQLVGPAIDSVIGRRMPDATQVQWEQLDKVDVGVALRISGLLNDAERGASLPVTFMHPTPTWNSQVVIWLHPDGKAGLLDDEGKPIEPVARLLRAEFAVMGLDLIHQGEFLRDGKPLKQTPRVKNTREAAAYTLGYNPSVFAQRVHDALAAVAFVRAHEYTPKAVHLVGLSGAGHWAAAARAQSAGAVDRAAIDTGGFRFADVDDIRALDFLPGGAKYHDLPGMLSLRPDPLWLAGEKEVPAVVAAVYQASGKPAHLQHYSGDAKKTADAAVDWLIAGLDEN